MDAPLGTEWVIDGLACDAAKLRDPDAVIRLLERLVAALDLHPVAPPLVHRFGGEGGVTALVLLSESHVAVHTFPEHEALTLNVYCCRPRAPIVWSDVLAEMIGARRVSVRTLPRGSS